MIDFLLYPYQKTIEPSHVNILLCEQLHSVHINRTMYLTPLDEVNIFLLQKRNQKVKNTCKYQEVELQSGLIAQACNPSYLGGRGRKIASLR